MKSFSIPFEGTTIKVEALPGKGHTVTFPDGNRFNLQKTATGRLLAVTDIEWNEQFTISDSSLNDLSTLIYLAENKLSRKTMVAGNAVRFAYIHLEGQKSKLPQLIKTLHIRGKHKLNLILGYFLDLIHLNLNLYLRITSLVQLIN